MNTTRTTLKAFLSNLTPGGLDELAMELDPKLRDPGDLAASRTLMKRLQRRFRDQKKSADDWRETLARHLGNGVTYPEYVNALGVRGVLALVAPAAYRFGAARDDEAVSLLGPLTKTFAGERQAPSSWRRMVRAAFRHQAARSDFLKSIGVHKFVWRETDPDETYREAEDRLASQSTVAPAGPTDPHALQISEAELRRLYEVAEEDVARGDTYLYACLLQDHQGYTYKETARLASIADGSVGNYVKRGRVRALQVLNGELE